MIAALFLKKENKQTKMGFCQHGKPFLRFSCWITFCGHTWEERLCGQVHSPVWEEGRIQILGVLLVFVFPTADVKFLGLCQFWSRWCWFWLFKTWTVRRLCRGLPWRSSRLHPAQSQTLSGDKGVPAPNLSFLSYLLPLLPPDQAHLRGPC